MKTVTITQEQMEKSFAYLTNVISLKNMYKTQGNKEEYEKYLCEFCGILEMYYFFGIMDDWDEWRADQIRKEFAND